MKNDRLPSGKVPFQLSAHFIHTLLSETCPSWVEERVCTCVCECVPALVPLTNTTPQKKTKKLLFC